MSGDLAEALEGLAIHQEALLQHLNLEGHSVPFPDQKTSGFHSLGWRAFHAGESFIDPTGLAMASAGLQVIGGGEFQKGLAEAFGDF